MRSCLIAQHVIIKTIIITIVILLHNYIIIILNITFLLGPNFPCDYAIAII